MADAQITTSHEPALKTRLKSDLTDSMRARDAIRTGTIRMALTAIHAEEVAGTTARGLSDDEVVTVLGREAKKRREAATAYDGAARPELAERERAELAILEGYLPQQLSTEEIAAIVTAAVNAEAQDGVTGKGAMGAVMKRVKPAVAGVADGAQVAAEVRRQLGL